VYIAVTAERFDHLQECLPCFKGGFFFNEE